MHRFSEETPFCHFIKLPEFPDLKGINSLGEVVFTNPRENKFSERDLFTGMYLELWKRYQYIIEQFDPEFKHWASGISGTPSDWSHEIIKLENILSFTAPETIKVLEIYSTSFHDLLDLFSKIQFTDTPDLLLQEVKTREISYLEALSDLRNQPPVRIHLYCDITFGAGTFGTALQIAEEITERLPSALVRIATRYGNESVARFGLRNAHSDRILCFDQNSSAWRTAEQSERPDLVIYLQPTTNLSNLQINEVVLKTMPDELTNPPANPFGITLNVGSQFISVPRSPGLSLKREDAQKLSFHERATQRIGFIEKMLSEENQMLLSEVAKKRDYIPEHAIWSWAYFQDSRNVVNEIKQLADVCKKNPDFFAKVMKETGKQVVYFMARGEVAKNDKYLTSLVQHGVAVIGNGNVEHLEADIDQVPITIVIVDGMPRQDLIEFQSKLLGTMVRDKNDHFWIDYPIICTGNASWFEALSTGGLWAHDGFDARSGIFSHILTPLLEKLFTIVDNSTDSSKISRKAYELLKNCLMGVEGRNVEKVYSNLESKTRIGRSLAKAGDHLSMGKDLIRMIAWLRELTIQ